MPFGVAVLEPSRSASAAAQESYGVVGEHAVRAPAVGDDLDVGGQFADAGGEAVDRDRSGAGDVTGGVLGGGAYVDDDDVTGGDALGQLGAADLLERAAIAEVVAAASSSSCSWWAAATSRNAAHSSLTRDEDSR